MSLIGKETTDFVRACEAIHAQMEYEPLTPDERDLIKWGCLDLLNKLKPAATMRVVNPQGVAHIDSDLPQAPQQGRESGHDVA